MKTPDKENAIFFARQNVALRDDDEDYPALYVANYIMGGGAGFDSASRRVSGRRTACRTGRLDIAGVDRPRGQLVGLRDRGAVEHRTRGDGVPRESRAR